MSYPKREAYFAHKFVRVLHKSCAAQDIGTQACYLLCVIAHTEDAARYRTPARFWNGQLMETLGFTSPKQLDNARDAAIEAGWLQYDRAGNRKVGEYFVTIPDQFKGLSDAEIEPNHSPGGMNNGMNEGMNNPPFIPNGERIAERKGNGRRNESETESGKPPIPVPYPCPNTLSLTLADGEFEFPQRWQIPSLIRALGNWAAHIQAQGKHFQRMHLQALLNHHASAGWSAERLERGINLSLSKSAQTTIIDPDEADRPRIATGTGGRPQKDYTP